MLLQVYFFRKHLVSEIMKEANGVNPYHMTITNFPKYFILLMPAAADYNQYLARKYYLFGS